MLAPWIWFSAAALADPFIVWGSSTATTDHMTLSVNCQLGFRTIGGGGDVFSTVNVSHKQRVSQFDAEAAWHIPPGISPESLLTNAHVFAICTEPQAADCVEEIASLGSQDSAPEKSLSLSCPAGTFAMGADYEIGGDVDSIEVYTHRPTGLLAPTGWITEARVMDGTAPSWRLSGWLRCAPAEAYGALTVLPLDDKQSFEFDLSEGYYPIPASTWGGIYGDHAARYTETKGALSLGFGFHVLDGVPGGHKGFLLATNGPDTPWPVLDVVGFLPESGLDYEVIEDPITITAEDPSAFEDLLLECDAKGISAATIDRFRVGGTIWYGLANGGGGVIFLPGSGPVPVDPEPFHAAFDALPVGLASYFDPSERDARIAAIGLGLSAERTPWSIASEPSATLRGEGVVMVVPRDEIAAIQWLSANRSALAALSHTTLVFLREGGEGQAALSRW